MANSRDRILIVENDPVISDLVGRQALQGAGYQVAVVCDAGAAIAKALQWSPDLIITNLNLPGLSGKDLMVALVSQGIQTPVILLAERGMEMDIIQAFRLGAADYLLLPVREAEVIAAVSRVLKQVHNRRERDRLEQQLQKANRDLQDRVRELTTMFAVGKAVTSVTDQSTLLDKVLDGAIRVTQADLGWFLLREDTGKPFIVAAEHNLPASLGVKLRQPWDDGISSLVAMSGEPLTIHGDPLKRFKISSLGLSALIVPIKAQKKVIGLLVMMRKQPQPFGSSAQHLLEALADYASISLMNARLFRALEDRARSMQSMAESAQLGEKINTDLLHSLKQELDAPVSTALATLDKLAKDPTARWRSDQRQLLTVIQDSLLAMRQTIETVTPHPMPKAGQSKPQADLAEQIRLAVHKHQSFAQQNGLSLLTEGSQKAVLINMEPDTAARVLESLLGSVLRFSSKGSLVTARLEKSAQQAHFMICTSGINIAPKAFDALLDDSSANGRSRGTGIRLSLAKEIVTTQRGKVWLEPGTGKEMTLHLTLPLAGK